MNTPSYLKPLTAAQIQENIKPYDEFADAEDHRRTYSPREINEATTILDDIEALIRLGEEAKEIAARPERPCPVCTPSVRCWFHRPFLPGVTA